MFFRKKAAPDNALEEAREESGRKKLTFMVKKEVKQHLEAGRNSLNQGRIDDAISHYRSAVETDPSCALSHFNLAYAYHEKGLQESALDAYGKAVELEPTCSLFLENLARLQFETSDYRESARLFHRASMVGPIQPISLGLWGRALFEQGLYEQAIETFENLLERDHQPLIQLGGKYWLAMGHIKQGRVAAARRITETILKEKDLDAKILFDLGEHFVEARCISLSRKIFERLLNEKDEILAARLRLDDIKRLEEQIDEALPKLFDGDEERLLHQIHALREFGSDKISKALISMLDSPSAPVRENIIRYQTAFGYDAGPKILPLIEDPVVYVREAAYEYFEKLDRGEYLDKLKAGLYDPMPSITRIVARVAGRFGSIDMAPELEMLAGDPRCRECREDIRDAIASVKRRYQKQQDMLYRMKIKPAAGRGEFPASGRFQFWLLLVLQCSVIGYLIYYLFTRL
ncbi:MAG: tetratricopeptide repeat protein [bacterium]|nr:tetratricopeptide repeat protein [bacterium]